MQNANTVIRPRPSRFQPPASSPPGDARSWVTRTKLQVAVCAPLQPVHPADLWTYGSVDIVELHRGSSVGLNHYSTGNQACTFPSRLSTVNG